MVKKNSIDILLELSLDRLNAQIKRIDGIDTKIGITFGLANGITAVLVAFTTLLIRPVHQLVLAFVTLTAIAYITTLVLLFFAYRWGKWSFRPDLNTLRSICTDPQYYDYLDIVKKWIVNECIRSMENNGQPIINKVHLANQAIIALSIQGLLLAASFISYLFI